MGEVIQLEIFEFCWLLYGKGNLVIYIKESRVLKIMWFYYENIDYQCKIEFEECLNKK